MRLDVRLTHRVMRQALRVLKQRTKRRVPVRLLNLGRDKMLLELRCAHAPLQRGSGAGSALATIRCRQCSDALRGKKSAERRYAHELSPADGH